MPFFPLQKLENITKFLRSAKVTNKKKEKRKTQTTSPPPSNKSGLFAPKNSTPP
jgi:hypothetical protein